jgi:hypothetical protein
MTYRVELTARAGRNLKRIFRHINAESSPQASVWFNELEAAILASTSIRNEARRRQRILRCGTCFSAKSRTFIGLSFRSTRAPGSCGCCTSVTERAGHCRDGRRIDPAMYWTGVKSGRLDVEAVRFHRRGGVHRPERGWTGGCRTEILAAVDIAKASVERGEGTEITQESMRALAEDVKRRGRTQLAAEHHPAG